MTVRRDIPWIYDAAKQNLKDSRRIQVNATTQPIAMGVTQDIWPETGVQTTVQMTADTFDIVSTSANDDIAGSRARQVRVRGLDQNFLPVNEVVDLAGTTPVTTANSYFRLTSMEVIRGGTVSTTTFPVPAGDISIARTSGGPNYGVIRPLLNGFSQKITRNSHISVPLGFEGYITQLLIFANNNCSVSLHTRSRINDISTDFGTAGSLVQLDEFSDDVVFNLPTPIFIDEATDIWGVVTTTAADTVVQMSYVLIGLPKQGGEVFTS